MASMNNWLGFSLSSQEIPPQDQMSSAEHHNISSSGGDCFDLTSADSTSILPSLNLPAAAPFGILEAFKRNNHSSQDWKYWKEAVSTNYKNGVLMERSPCNISSINPSSSLENENPPKLENFLGGHSFISTDQNHKPSINVDTTYAYPNNNNNSPSQTNPTSSTIGLSMIKNWLRNNPSSQSSAILSSQHEEKFMNNDDDQYFNASAAAEAMNFSAAQNLSLSMSTGGSQSTSALPLLTGGGSSDGDNAGEMSSSSTSENKQPNIGGGMAAPASGVDAQSCAIIEAVPRKSIDTFGQRTSIYRGVTRHRWTGRYEAHLWDNSCRREGQTRKGRQVYLGGYDKEEKAARAYDLAALKYWGTTTTTNFPISNYEKEIEEMKHMTRQEYVASLRRKSSGFSRGASIYRGVTRHHQHGRWQARIGRVAGNKDLYLGTFSTQEEAAEAYDIAAIKFRGLNAVTNFEISRYDVKSILESTTLPIGGAAKRLKDAEQAEMAALEAHHRSTTTACPDNNEHILSGSSHLTDQGMINGYGSSTSAHHAAAWPPTIAVFPPQAQPLAVHYPYGGQQQQQQQQRLWWCKQENQDSDDVVAAAGHGFQDFHTLQVGNTHNFLQQPSVLHNLMSLDSGGSDSAMYGNGAGSGGQSGENASSYHGVGGYGSVNGGGGYLLPMSTTEGNQCNIQGNGVKLAVNGYETMYGGGGGSTDPNQPKNFYNNYLPQHASVSSNNGTLKAADADAGVGGSSGVYDHQGSSCNTWWVPTAVPALAARPNAMAVCHGSSTFSVWNDT